MTQQTSPHIQSSDVLVAEPCASDECLEASIGDKIRSVRLEKGMTLDQLANETGCSITTLENIENNQLTPPVGNLLQISKALSLDSGFLFKESQKFHSRVEASEKRTANYAYTNLTPGKEKKHLKAFIVTLDPLTDHEGVGFQHEGEEFNYVLGGEVEVTVGDHVNYLKSGDALHFNAGIRHNLKNTKDQTARLLVVIYTP
ncbi:MAG: transcriptional regulator (XRE family protein) [Candidatus Magnetoglobus multicellularis str. Araruama]|uniref:Transcriptional regulator (XRE family protein) n=1 Tax=Candidatus Magnetoglobus multicellularis str. Araruama TaxID=890399 RepID=A0A1V1PEP0_9BACT|nr:MAG: transcriptional regulator (XRE family protein) [Candidatus Magnetoglobus multicellularis str. Araruama]